MKHYNLKYNNKIIKKLTQDGFICEIPGKNGNKFFVYRDNGPKYLVHSGGPERYLKKWLRDEYGYEL